MTTAVSDRIDVLCAGIIVVDHVCAPLRRIPASGQLELTERIDLAIGGSAANVGLDLRKLGRRVSVAGCVGDDVLGHYAAQVLTSGGVKCEHIAYSPLVPTSTTLVVNVEGDDRRFIHAVGANTQFTGSEIPMEALQGCRALYVGGFGLNAALSGANVAKLFSAARQAGVLTVLDVVVGAEDVAAMLAPVLPLTDLFLPNEDEGRAITGFVDPLDQARRFQDGGAACVVITCGPQGAILLNGEQSITMNAHSVPQVDATGGGDAFVAGYVHAHLEGKSAEECLAYGSALGASCVQAPGATTGVLGADDLERFVRTHPLKAIPIN